VIRHSAGSYQSRYQLEGEKRTNRKIGFLSTVYSIQLSPNAIMLERLMVTTMNLRISMLPHTLSRYFREGGTKMRVAMNCGLDQG
jgi:hypothetical protein